MKLIILGPPAGGKGTQAHLLAEKFDLISIASGDLLRDEIQSKSQSGKEIDALISKGEFVSDELINDIILKKIKNFDKTQGYILDGFPRTYEQAKRFYDSTDERIDIVIGISIDDSKLVSRIVGRRICLECHETYHLKFNPPETEGVCDHCQSELTHRDDDKPDTIKSRLKLYHARTEPLKQFYIDREKYIEVDGSQSIDAISKEIISILEKN